MARVVVWGTGNVGRPAIRAVAAHRDLDLAGVIVANPDKVGVDAGALAGLEPLGVAATDALAISVLLGLSWIVIGLPGALVWLGHHRRGQRLRDAVIDDLLRDKLLGWLEENSTVAEKTAESDEAKAEKKPAAKKTTKAKAEKSKKDAEA